MERPDPWQAWG